MDSAIIEFTETGNHRRLRESFAIHKTKIDGFFQNSSNLFLDRKRVLFELAFCLCTPQSKATHCRDAVRRMQAGGILEFSTKEQLLNCMQAVRFNDKKSDYIIRAQGQFEQIYVKILQLKERPEELREWLAGNVMGFGMKEASHFLRNIGLGENLAILDVHIIREMQQLSLTDKTSSGLSKKAYLEIERRFASLAKTLNMSVAELDCTI